MGNINEKYYPDLENAVAFKIAFAPVICTYGNVNWYDIEKRVCTRCGKDEQIADFLASKSACNKDYAILDIFHYAVSIAIRNELLENFDVCEQDFRPVRNKTGDIVFYQITPQHTMLPVGEVNRVRALKPCRKCGLVQYREKEYKNKQGRPYAFITKEALEDLADLNVSYEKYEMYIPWFVVSRRVYEFLISRYPRMNFVPLYLKA